MRERLYRWVRRLVKHDEAAVATEYAILLGVIALVIVVGATAFGTALNGDYNFAANATSGLVSGS